MIICHFHLLPQRVIMNAACPFRAEWVFSWRLVIHLSGTVCRRAAAPCIKIKHKSSEQMDWINKSDKKNKVVVFPFWTYNFELTRTLSTAYSSELCAKLLPHFIFLLTGRKTDESEASGQGALCYVCVSECVDGDAAYCWVCCWGSFSCVSCVLLPRFMFW